MRIDQRKLDQLREIKFQTSPTKYAEGSVLIQCGNTHLLCTATVEDNVPKWMQGLNRGWITAEYGMLPRSTHTRMKREQILDSGRTQEISRLIARSLRASVDLNKLGEKQIIVDCDVLQADGGTRTTAITGGFVALAMAISNLLRRGDLSVNPLKHYVAAVSIGLKDGKTYSDLCYEEDSQIGTDMNFVMTSENRFVEVQGTAETQTFSEAELAQMAQLARQNCNELFLAQSRVIGEYFPLASK